MEDEYVAVPPDSFRLVMIGGNEPWRYLAMNVPKTVDKTTQAARMLLIELLGHLDSPHFEENEWADMAKHFGCSVDELLAKLRESPFVEYNDQRGLQWMQPESE